MLELTRAYLQERNAFSPEQSPFISQIAKTIPFSTVPDRMKLTIAVSEIMTFASQFRRNIQHWDGTPVPINAISFVVTASGQHKDSSVRAARKCFSLGYKAITTKREQLAKTAAIRLAQESGETDYAPFYKPPAPIFMSPTTGPGLIQHINDIAEYPLGAGLLYAGELGDELATNADILENIKTLAEVYDVGEKEVKYTKGVDSRSAEIKGQPVSALLVGSPTYILYDEPTKKKFQIAFMSKLARRSWFCYIPEVLAEADFDSIEAFLESENSQDFDAINLQESIAAEINSITQHQLPRADTLITIDRTVVDLFKVYKRYNTEVAANELAPSSVSALVRKHLQWKALKLAGALALLSCSDIITADHYLDAIRFCEVLSTDMELFESELNKLSYERFADYIQTCVDSTTGKASIDIHNLKKKGFIPNTTNPKVRLKELITPAAVYDKLGIYTVSDDGTYIHYERIHQTDTLLVSIKPIDNSRLFAAIASGAPKETIDDIKGLIATSATYGYDCEEASFADLSQLLQGNYAYSPFRFRDGVRGKANITSGAKWVVLDIDSSIITAEEAHFMLSDINHHIALGSDKNNHFKFRVLLELDSSVEVDAVVWRNFYLAIANDLALTVDPLPQSQIFYSYWEDDRPPIYSITDASPILVRDYLMAAHEAAERAPSTVAKTLSTSQKKALLADELTTFSRAFNARNGEGSRSLIWAAKYAFYDLGMPKDEVIQLLHRINNYWVYPLPEDRFNNTVIQQVLRW